MLEKFNFVLFTIGIIYALILLDNKFRQKEINQSLKVSDNGAL
jgi:hypothetical protein